METQIIRSKRKTFALELRGSVLLIRAPLQATEEEIERMLAKHQRWIEKARARQERWDCEAQPMLTAEEIRALADQALSYIPKRLEYYAPQIGVTYGRVTIRRQKSRWGSCSSKGNLNFNCLLMLSPPEVIDSVVVHELCHRKEMNHSERFYTEVLRVYPDYWKWHDWLNDHGETLMRRMTG